MLAKDGTVDPNSDRNFANSVLTYSDYVKLAKHLHGLSNAKLQGSSLLTPEQGDDEHLRVQKIKQMQNEAVFGHLTVGDEKSKKAATKNTESSPVPMPPPGVPTDAMPVTSHSKNNASTYIAYSIGYNDRKDPNKKEDKKNSEEMSKILNNVTESAGSLGSNKKPGDVPSENSSDHQNKKPGSFLVKIQKKNKTPTAGAEPSLKTLPESKSDITDDIIDDITNNVNDVDDILPAYDDDEFVLIDDHTGKIFEPTVSLDDKLNEVLSREERIKVGIALKKGESRRLQHLQIALKRFSTPDVLKRRARELAIKTLKKKFTGKDSTQLSVSEKEKIELFLQKHESMINKLSNRLMPKIKQIEKDRMSHSKITKEK